MFQPDPPSAPPGDTPIRLLFVCSGNTCRSPLAEALARKLAAGSGLGPLEIRSAGTAAVPGSPASAGARRAARRHGLSLEDHSANQVSAELILWADKILAMEPYHVQTVRRLGAGEKVAGLGVFAEGVSEEYSVGDLAVPDPFGGDDQSYEETFRILERYVTLAVERLTGARGRG
jgi:protein-tyrosine-phosphatase